MKFNITAKNIALINMDSINSNDTRLKEDGLVEEQLSLRLSETSLKCLENMKK